MAYYGQGASQYKEMVVPAILIALVLLVAAVKILQMCWIPVIGPLICGAGAGSRTMIITNPDNYGGAENFANYLGSRVTRVNPVIHEDVASISEGYLTSGDYDMVVLYGDQTALTSKARAEITNYVNDGGNLMIVKGAGIKGLKSDGVTISPYLYGWQVGDMDDIIDFSPDCPTAQSCETVNDVTITSSTMSDVKLVPTQWDNAVIERTGTDEPIEVDISQYSNFTGIVDVVDEGNNKILKISWKDGSGNVHSAPAIITYKAGAAGGKVTYLGYNPQKMEQEALFRNTVLHTLGKV